MKKAEKVLVINNDFDTMSLIKGLLEKKHFDVTYNGSGTEAVALAEQVKPAIILIDVLHNERIGEFKKNPATAHIPIILMTGYTWANEFHNKTQADMLIIKPFFLNELEQKIQAALALKR